MMRLDWLLFVPQPDKWTFTCSKYIFFLPYLRFSHCKDELLRAFLPDAGLPLLAGDHHEVVTTAAKSDDRLVGVG